MGSSNFAEIQEIMKKPVDHERLTYNGRVVVSGTRAKCFDCDDFYEETAKINGRQYCHECVSKKFPNNAAKFEKSDALFRCPREGCPREGCGVQNLSFAEYMVGSCCKKASVWSYVPAKYGNFFKLTKIYAEIKVETAQEKVKTCQKALEDAKTALENAEKEAECSLVELKVKNKWRRKVQNRTFFLAKIAMKEDNSDFEDYDEDENTAPNQYYEMSKISIKKDAE